VGLKHVSCIVRDLSTGFPQEEAGEELPDILDVPPFFGVPSDVPDDVPADLPTPTAGLPQAVAPTPPELGRGGTFGGGGASGTWNETKVRTKPGVVLPRGGYMQGAIEIAAQRGDVITSGNDAAHLPNSLHYENLAIDVRPAPDFAVQVMSYRLAGYKVLVEGLVDPATSVAGRLTPKYGTGAHLHISFDPKGKRV